jgi:hypothetical protein
MTNSPPAPDGAAVVAAIAVRAGLRQVSFVNALYFAGVFSGVILSIMPILMLKGARQRGDLTRAGPVRPG